MLFVDFEVGDKAYKLRINTRNVVQLEKALGCNPLGIFGDGEELPKITDMVAVLHSALQQYQSGITKEDAYNIFDDYLADGNTMTDFVHIILKIYQVSGIIPTDANNEEKKNNEKN